MAPQAGLRQDQHFPNVLALFRILLKIVPGWCFTPSTLSTPSALRCALVVTGIEDRYQSPHPSQSSSRVLKKQNRHRDTETQRRGRIRTYLKRQQILTCFVLIFLCVSVSLWLRLVFHQPARGYVAESWARHPSGPFGVMSKVAGRSEPGLSQSVLRPKTASMEGRLAHLDGNVQPSLRC
jgi:hypothetical protein